MRRWLSITGVVLGVLLIAAAAVVRWVVAPSVAVLPSDTNTTRTYTGQAAALLNPAGLTGTGPVMLTGVPITVTHQDQVLATNGDNALVSDVQKVQAAGTTVAAVTQRYAVNRTDLGRGSGYPGVTQQTGLTFNWPIRTAKKDYQGWVADTGRTTTLTYTGTALRGGVNTYVFTAATTPAPITDPKVLAALPASLPKASFQALALGLNLPAAEQAALAQALPSLPDTVPFSYTYQVNATYWVQPTTGIVVDVAQHEIRTLALPLGGTVTPVTPVMDITFAATPAAATSVGQDASSKASSINLVYGRLPLILLIAGVLIGLTGAGTLLTRPRRGPQPPTVPVTGPRDPALTGR